jgi:glutaredoxin-like protein
MFSESDRAALERRFASMGDPITLLVFADDGPISRQLTEFANALAATSPSKLRVEVQGVDGGKNPRMRELKLDHWPVMMPTKADFSRIRYYGVPAGYEIAPVVEGLVELSVSRTGLSPRAKEALVTVRRKANIKVFVLPTCHFCPIVAKHAYRAAIESKNVSVDVIDTQMFPDLATRHAVMGVPKVILNDNLDITGAMGEVEFFDKLRDSDHALLDSMYG